MDASVEAAGFTADQYLTDIDINIRSAAELLQQDKSSLRPLPLGTGVKSIDSQIPNIFTSGSVIGLGHAVHDESFNLSTHLASSFLLRQANTNDGMEQMFIIAPPNTSIISDVHASLCRRLASEPLHAGQTLESTALRLLENVQLLRYLDLAGLAESLSEVSQTLFDSHQKNMATSTGTADKRALSTTDRSHGSIIWIQGLCQILNSTQRRSGTIQNCAILSNLMRTIRQLSRTYHDLIVLVEVEISTDTQDIGIDQSSAQLESAFSVVAGGSLRIVNETNVANALEQGLDVLLCVHDGFGKTGQVSKDKPGAEQTQTRIVEVIIDRMGSSFGQWCIWVQ